MSDSSSNNQQTTVNELPSYTDLGNRSQIESLVQLNSPPTHQAQANQMAFSQSVPVGANAYDFMGRPIYYKPNSPSPIYFPPTQQYQPQPQQFQHHQPQYQVQPRFAPVVHSGPFVNESARQAYLKESYPTGYVVFHNVFLILLSLVIITLQTLLIFENAFMSFVGGGCWSGVWLLFTAIFSLSSVGCKSNCTIISSVVFQLISLVFVFIGCVAMSSVNLSADVPCWDYSYCDKSTVWQLLYSLTAIGVCIMILCLIFSVFILVRFTRARRQHDTMVNMQYTNMYAQQQQHQAQAYANPNYYQQARFNNQPQRLA